jgi:pilus assembly protein Flp/PilA
MKSIIGKIARFFKTEIGPTAVEYAVIIALIILVCLTSIIVVGRQTNSSFENSQNEITKSMGQ